MMGVLTGDLTPRKSTLLAMMYMKTQGLIGNSGDVPKMVCD